MAAATAIARARAGEQVLLVSIDQAHSLADALQVRIEHDPGTTSAVQSVQSNLGPGERSDGSLDVIEIDTHALLTERYAEVAKMAGGGGHNHNEFAMPDAGELVGLPPVQELLGLSEIATLVGDEEWDVIIVDCGPTVDALNTLTAPERFLGYLERIWPRHKRVASAISRDVRKVVLVATIERIADAVSGVRELLADTENTGVRLVTTPEWVTVAQTSRLRSALALHGLRLDSVIVNKLLPQLDSHETGQAAQWYANRRSEQMDVVAALERWLPGVPFQTVQHTGPEPVGLSSLGTLAYGIDWSARAAAPKLTVEKESGDGSDSGYVMRMFLPVVDPSTLSLGRVEDDVIVGADGARRRIRLAAALRRSVVSGAELDGQYFVVRFRAQQ